MDSDIVIELRGGCLVGVYCADRKQRFVVLDWDDLNDLRELERKEGVFPAALPSEMPRDTKRAYENSISGERGGAQ